MADVYACQCGKSFNTPQGLGAHSVSHETVVCIGCGRSVNRRGLGSHRRTCPGSTAIVVREEEHLRIVECLRDLTPPLFGAEALERAALLIDRHPDHRGLFIVAGVTYGPHLTSRQNVGGIVAKAHEPCVVIDLDLLPAPAVNDKPAAWPHARRG